MCRKRASSSVSPQKENSASKFSGGRLLYDGQSIHSPTNATLILENIKQEVDSMDALYSERAPLKTHSASKRSLSHDGYGISEAEGFNSFRYSLKACKHEDESLADGGDTSFTLFASLLDSGLQGV